VNLKFVGECETFLLFIMLLHCITCL